MEKYMKTGPLAGYALLLKDEILQDLRNTK
jgi:hypothetical protein